MISECNYNTYLLCYINGLTRHFICYIFHYFQAMCAFHLCIIVYYLRLLAHKDPIALRLHASCMQLRCKQHRLALTFLNRIVTCNRVAQCKPAFRENLQEDNVCTYTDFIDLQLCHRSQKRAIWRIAQAGFICTQLSNNSCSTTQLFRVINVDISSTRRRVTDVTTSHLCHAVHFA